MKYSVLLLALFNCFCLKGQVVQKVSNAKQHVIGPVFNGKLYFSADDGVHGYELWVYDTLSSVVQMVTDLSPNSSAGPFFRTVFDNKLIFTAEATSGDRQIWSTDGTAANTHQLTSIMGSGNDFSATKEVDNKLYFTCCDATTGGEIWQTDGTAAGTKRLIDITGKAFFKSHRLEVLNNKLLFYSSENSAIYDQEPWVSDGTAVGTYQLKEINPMSHHGCLGSSFFVFNNKAYFSATADSVSLFPIVDTNHNLWETDGTTAGTQLLKDIDADSNASYQFFNLGSKMMFVSYDKATMKHEMWTSDGTPQGTKKLMDVSDFTAAFVFKDRLYFEKEKQPGLWVTDGAVAGMNYLKDISPIRQATSVELNNRLYFLADRAESNGMVTNIWSTDGTPAGTVNLTGTFDPKHLQNSSQLVRYGDWIYFRANFDDQGDGLWRLYSFPLSVADISVETEISIVPNPSDGKLTIRDAKDNLINALVSLYSIRGEEVFGKRTVPASGQLELDLPTGVYFLKYINGARYTVKRINVIR